MPIYTGHECDAAAYFAVENTGIPIIDEGVTVHEQKDGILSFNRRAEATFPIKTEEGVWTDEIDAFREGGSMQIAEIGMAPVDINGKVEGEREPLFRGYINGVGSREAANAGRVMLVGPFKLLSSIPATTTFNTTGGLDVDDILSWFVEEFRQGQDIIPAARYETELEGVGLRDLEDYQSGGFPGFDNTAYGFGRLVETRDTLADAAKIMLNKLGLVVWFDPDPYVDNGVVLRATTKSGFPGENYDVTEGGDVPLVANNSIYEMRPFNTLQLRGEMGVDIEIGDFADITIPGTAVVDDNYPLAEAYYEPLVERAGGRIKRTQQSKAKNESEAAVEAEAGLKDMLDEVSGGTMDTALAPQIKPYDTVTAKPACAGIIDTDTPELTFEVERIAHTLAPKNQDNNIPQSELAVSMHIDPDKIGVDTWTETTQPSKESENEPPEEDPASDFTWTTAP